jgi:hypothetical protein
MSLIVSVGFSLPLAFFYSLAHCIAEVGADRQWFACNNAPEQIVSHKPMRHVAFRLLQHSLSAVGSCRDGND